MKILISNCGQIDGPNFYRTYCLANGLLQRGHSITMMTSPGVSQGKIDHMNNGNEINFIMFSDIVPKRFRQAGFGIIDPVLRTMEILHSKYDVFFADSGFRPACGLPCWIGKVLKNVPYVCEWWDLNGRGGQFDLRPLLGRYTIGVMDSFMEKLDKKLADGIVCVSSFLQEKCIEMKIPKEKTLVLHGGADIEGIPFIERSIARSKLGLGNGFLLGIAGINKAELRNLAPFFKALKKLQRDFPDIAWFSTGAELTSQQVRDYDIGREHIELGWLSYAQYGLYLSAADVLLCPLENSIKNISRWPNKLGDYLAAGRPIVSNAVGEIKIFSEKYPNTIVVTNWEEKDIFETLRSLLLNKNKAKELGVNARKVAEQEYSWTAKAAELEIFLGKIISERSANTDGVI